MSTLPPSLVRLVESGPLAHLSTVNADGSPQVSAIWIGLDGDTVVSAHLGDHVKLRNIRREPRVVLSFDGPREPGQLMAAYAVLHADAEVVPSDQAWDLLDRLAKVYVAPDAGFPAPRVDGFIVRYTVRRVGGHGPWAS